MRKVIVHEYVSADGFVAAPDGDIDWLGSIGGDVDDLMLRELDDIDTILLGARTYEEFVQFWPTPESTGEPIAERLNAMAKVVFSTRLGAAPWGEWPQARVDSGGRPPDSVAGLKREPGRSMVVWGSITLAQALIDARLVDEIWLGVAPVALGRGVACSPAGPRWS
jgi:dihydrofolate reductase